MTNHKRLHVITWGCQMNVYDSGRMADVLAPLGYVPTPTPDDADMVILNTCHIRDRAAELIRSSGHAHRETDLAPMQQVSTPTSRSLDPSDAIADR